MHNSRKPGRPDGADIKNSGQNGLSVTGAKECDDPDMVRIPPSRAAQPLPPYFLTAIFSLSSRLSEPATVRIASNAIGGELTRWA